MHGREGISSENKIIEFSKSEHNEAAISLIREELDDTILRNINEKNREELYQKSVKHLAEVGTLKKPSPRDSASIILGTFLASTVAGLIVLAPFLLMDDLSIALNISNMLGISLLFMIGYYRSQGRDLSAKLTIGLGTAIIGMIIAVITILLGG
jgi:VIT1/CCC1 family predicted Fe2+/Mn2+ transporter